MGALRAKDAEMQLRIIPELNRLIATGVEEREVWEELFDVIERRRRLVESEIRNATNAQRVIAIEVVIAYLGQLVIAVKEAAFKHTDDQTAKKIVVAASDSYARIVGTTDSE
jgi:hypothetical protein